MQRIIQYDVFEQNRKTGFGLDSYLSGGFSRQKQMEVLPEAIYI